MYSRYDGTSRFLLLCGVLLFSGCNSGAPLETIVNSALQIPEAIAPELAVVRAHPDAFSVDSNPLGEVASCTILDDLTNIQGCWGTFRQPALLNEANDAIAVRYDEFHILKFMGANRAEEFVLTVLVEGDGAILGISLDGVYYVRSYEYEILDVAHIRFHITEQGAGSFRSDGEVVFELGISVVAPAVSVGSSFDACVTTQGEFLKTESSRDTPPGFAENTLHWVRVACE